MAYLNSKQKKALIYMSVAGALLLGKEQGLFKLKYPFLVYQLQQVDKHLKMLSNQISHKDRRQIERMINNMDADNTDSEFENVFMAWLCLDWCIDNAFGLKKYGDIRKALMQASKRLREYAKKFVNDNNKKEIEDTLIKFCLEVKL